MKITKETLKQLIKEEFRPGQRRNALERLIRDAAEDALKQGKGPEDIGLMVVDMLAKAGVNLDPRRNLLDPETSDPDTIPMQKIANQFQLDKMKKSQDDLATKMKSGFEDDIDLMKETNLKDTKMKITKSYLKKLIKEEIENLDENPFGDRDPFDDMDRKRKREAPGTEKYDCGSQPADAKEAKAMAIAGLKAAKGKDSFEEMDALRAHCISGTKRGRSGGQVAHQVIFKNRARIVVMDSDLQ